MRITIAKLRFENARYVAALTAISSGKARSIVELRERAREALKP